MHRYRIDEPGGYVSSAMISTHHEATDGNVVPQRTYDPADYVPATKFVLVPGSDDPSHSVEVRGYREIDSFFASAATTNNSSRSDASIPTTGFVGARAM